MTGRELIVRLDEPGAVEPTLTGGKASALARAANSGVAALPGVVLTTAFSAAVDRGAEPKTHPAVREAFELAGGPSQSLVARSSSVVEDQAGSSMAGQFESVIGIDGLGEFADAVVTVLDSRGRAGAADQPIAVLVQPLIEPRYGGIMFGVDPVTGQTDHRVVTAVEGGPEPLVSGEVDGSRYVLDTGGGVVERAPGDGPELPADLLGRLMGLSARVNEVFGGVQDVEWALGTDDRLWLLQSRPVTTEIRGVPSGPIFGPGPVAETFPEPLARLEQDLWVPPLRRAVREAVLLAGAATPNEVAASPVVVTMDGFVAIDLELTRELVRKPPWWHVFNPIPAIGRLRSAWRIGRLRGALPGLVSDLADRVDADLEAVPKLTELSSRQLLGVLERGRSMLVSLHSHEILMGLLTDSTETRMTGASVALRVLAEARADGLTEEQILERSPVVLALTAPKVASTTILPPNAQTLDLGAQRGHSSDAGILREGLRLRVRWVQEIMGRAAWLVGQRLAAAGDLLVPAHVRRLTLVDLESIVTKRTAALPDVVAAIPDVAPRPLPACFRVSDIDRPVPVKRTNEVGGGTGAGGGTGTGPVSHDVDDPPAGAVLVTTTLSPGLGPLLPRLAGIITETGSVLSHLAILARESSVATVVGYVGAIDDFPEGSVVTVDGDTGHVTSADDEQETA